MINQNSKLYSTLLVPLLIVLGAMIFLIVDKPERIVQPTFIIKTLRTKLPASGGLILADIKKNHPAPVFKPTPNIKSFLLVPSYPRVNWAGKAPFSKGKVVEIVLSSQRFLTWQDGVLLGNFATSTGKPGYNTKVGHFKILDHYRYATGGIPGQKWGMPYFMGIYFAGSTENGIHELPFVNGLRESSRDFGYPVSHGCVRLPIGVASVVYNWADRGTSVVIHY